MKKKETHLKIDDVDYSSDLIIMLDKLRKEPELLLPYLTDGEKRFI